MKKIIVTGCAAQIEPRNICRNRINVAYEQSLAVPPAPNSSLISSNVMSLTPILQIEIFSKFRRDPNVYALLNVAGYSEHEFTNFNPRRYNKKNN